MAMNGSHCFPGRVCYAGRGIDDVIWDGFSARNHLNFNMLVDRIRSPSELAVSGARDACSGKSKVAMISTSNFLHILLGIPFLDEI